MPNRLNNLRGTDRCRFEQQGYPDMPSWLTDLGNEHFDRFERLGKLKDINEAIECLTRAVSLTPEDHPYMKGRQNNLGNSHHRRFKQLGKLEDIDKAIQYGTYAVSLTPESDPDVPKYLSNLGATHQSRFERLGELDDIDKAIQYGTRAVSLTPKFKGHSIMPMRLGNLGCVHRLRFERLRKLEDIDKAIEWGTRAVSLTPTDHPNMPAQLDNLGSAHQFRFEQLSKLEDINKAIECETRAVSLTPEDHLDMPSQLNNLGNKHFGRFKRLGKLEDIDKAVECLARAASLTPEDHPSRPALLNNLGTVHRSQFKRLGKPEDIEKAIEYATHAVSLTPEGYLGRPAQISALGSAYVSRFSRLGKPEDIEKAIKYATHAVSLTPEGHPRRPDWLSALGNAHAGRFNQLGKLEDIDKAIECRTHAISLTPEDHPSMPMWLNNLGNSHISRFEQMGKLEDIDKAIECGTRAVSLAPEGHPWIPMWLSNLGSAYQSRFERLDEPGDIGKAIEYGTHAVSLTPEGHPGRPNWFSALGSAHAGRFNQLGKLEDIDKAIECGTHAISLTPEDHPSMPVWLNNLGNSHIYRFEQMGKLEDIDKAIECGTRAVSLTPKFKGHPWMPKWLGNLGSAYQSRFEQLGKPEDFEKAIECGTHAVSLTPKGHPTMSIWLNGLGDAHISCFLSTGSLQSLIQSFRCYRDSSQLSTSEPFSRFYAARRWVKLASLYENSDLVPAHQTAMALVPEIVWLGGTIGKRYEDTQTVAQAVLESAAAAIGVQEYALALEWLEQGRSIVWNQILQLRNPVDDLSTAYPSLAADLRGLASQLHNSYSMPSGLSSPSHEPLSLEEAAQKHHQIAGQYETLLKEIRALPGFEGFLGPKRASELLTAVQTGPVVVINVHESRCDALIMLPGKSDIKHTPLPNLTAKKVADARAQLQTTLEQHGLRNRSSSRRPDKSAMERWRPDKSAMKPQDDLFKQLLMILWSTVTKPILEFLGYLRPRAAEPLPHITWCATGALSLLPLHAAGNYNQPGENLFSYAVSSFTPTISALVPFALPSFSSHSQLLAIGQEATPGQKQLPGTREELAAIKDCTQPPLGCMCIEGAEATRKTVLEEIERHDWVHLACHAHQDIDDPTESGFFLHDGMLSLATITQNSFKSKGLAFLSACQTATGDRRIADEAVHLASGMLMAGYPSVIGTMWSVKDSDAPIIAREVYGRLLKDGQMNHKDAARALHEAVAKLRKEVGEGAFERWAPFIHIGV